MSTDTNIQTQDEPLVDASVIDAPEGNAGSPGAPTDERLTPEQKAAFTKQAQTLAEYEGLFGDLQKHPNWANIKQYLVDGSVQTEPTQEDHAALDGILDRVTDDPEAKKALKELFSVSVAAAEKNAKIKFADPLAGAITRSQIDMARQAGALEAGLDAKTVASVDFQSFEKQYEAENPWIKYVKAADPKSAARLTAQAYRTTDDPASVSASNARVDDARDNSLERRSGSGGASRVSAGIPAGAVKIDRKHMTLAEIHEAKKAKKPIVFHGRS